MFHERRISVIKLDGVKIGIMCHFNKFSIKLIKKLKDPRAEDELNSLLKSPGLMIQREIKFGYLSRDFPRSLLLLEHTYLIYALVGGGIRYFGHLSSGPTFYAECSAPFKNVSSFLVKWELATIQLNFILTFKILAMLYPGEYCLHHGMNSIVRMTLTTPRIA